MEITVEYKVSTRVKRLSVVVHADGRVVVTRPSRISARTAEQFVQSRRKWIQEKVAYFMKHAARTGGVSFGAPRTELKGRYEEYKEQARSLVHARLQHYNEMYNFTYHTVAIRNQKSRWGSCSQQGNLNFNYKIALLPSHLADYIVVHELCHLGEHNHSQNFWQLVARTMPDYKQMRKELKGIALR